MFKLLYRTVAACLGQMKMSPEQSKAVGEYFKLTPEEYRWLETVPNRNTLNRAVPSDPMLYRFHEALGVYGPALKEVINEEIGDGVVSAIDYSIKVEKDGDRVKLIWSGKFLPYKSF